MSIPTCKTTIYTVYAVTSYLNHCVENILYWFNVVKNATESSLLKYIFKYTKYWHIFIIISKYQFFTEKHNIQFKFYLLKTIELTYILDSFNINIWVGFIWSSCILLTIIETKGKWATSLTWYDYIIRVIMRGKINYLLFENWFVLIYKTLSPLHPIMLCAKFGWNWPSGSGEEIFKFHQCIFTIS